MLPSRRTLTFALLSTLIAGFLLTGCEAKISTGDDTVDDASAELTIKRQYTEQFPNLKLIEISCESTEAKPGNTFTCEGNNDNGISLDFKSTVKSVDEDDDSINFTWTITKAVTDGTAYEKPSVKALRGTGTPVASVDCPEFEIVKGDQIDCEATMQDGSTRTAVLTLTDGNGGYRVKLTGSPSELS